MVVSIGARSEEDATMNLIESRFRLYDLYGKPMSWASLINAHNVLWHERKQCQRRAGAAHALTTARSITITGAGRAYLAERRARAK